MEITNLRCVRARTVLTAYGFRIFCLCCMTVASSALQVGVALLTKQIVDAAIAGTSGITFWGVLLGISLLALIVLHSLCIWLGGCTQDLCAARLRHALLAGAAYGEDESLYGYHSGALLSRGMDDVRTVCDAAVNILPTVAGQVARLMISFAAVVALYPPLCAILLLAGLAAAVGTAWLRPVIKKHHSQVRQAEEQVTAGMQESLQHLELIKGLGAERQILKRFAQRLEQSLQTHRMRRRWLAGRSTVLSAVSQLSTGVMLLWGAAQVASQNLSYGSLTAMLQLLSLLRGPVLGISGYWTRLTAAEVAEQRLDQLLDRQSAQPEPLQIDKVTGIVFEDVTFSYPDDEAPALEHFSAEFSLDRWVCLTGVSGRGKTTLFKLILGLYTPQHGRVYLRTDRGEVLCGADTRHLFAYVPQDYALLSGTILDNLLLAAPQATQEDCAKALHLAQADYVHSLSAGLQTLVRENNAGLSKGQLQRLAVARAILMDRSIFLLDECTSALDSDAEQALLENLLQLDKQGILVTHSPEALHRLAQRPGVSMQPM